MKAFAGALAAYSVDVAIMLVALTAVYVLFVRQVRSARLQRAVIVGTYAVSLMSPVWIRLAASGVFSGVSAGGRAAAGLPVIIVPAAEVSGGQAVDWPWLVAAVLDAGMVAALLLSLPGWILVFRGIIRGRRRRLGRYVLSLAEDDRMPVYSWGRWIVCPEKDFSRYGDIILVHETAHLRQLHWLDLLVAQAVTVLNWYNPAAWLLLDRLRDAHEFMADSAVLGSGVGKVEYVKMLMEKAVGKRVEVFANSLNHSQLKKRVTMMKNQKESVWRRLGVAAMLPALAAGVAFAAMPQVRGWLDGMGRGPAEYSVSGISGKVSENTATAGKAWKVYSSDSGEPVAAMSVPAAAEAGTAGSEELAAKPEKKESSQAFYVEGEKVSEEYLAALDPNNVEPMTVSKERNEVHLALKKPQGAEVSRNVAEYRGGMKALMNHMHKELRYPEDAIKNKVSGTAIVRLDIDSKGRVKEASIVKSAGYASLDKEALRVARTLNDWTVGIPEGETVSFVLPVRFKTE